MTTFSSDYNLRGEAKSAYKLWVRYKPQFVKPGQRAIRVYYSYDKPDDPDYGKRRLLAMVKERINVIEVAILYDNRTHIRINFFKHDQSPYQG